MFSARFFFENYYRNFSKEIRCLTDRICPFSLLEHLSGYVYFQCSDGARQRFSVKSVFEASAGLTELPSIIVERLNLSAIESNVCLGLIQGKQLDEIAEDHCHSRESIRVYFRKLLIKTGTDNEAKLVAVLLSLSNNQQIVRLPKSDRANGQAQG